MNKNLKRFSFMPVLSLILLLVSCNKAENRNGKNPAASEKIITIHDNVSTRPDEDFDGFLKKFNQDSAFQVSRIQFPLKVKESNPGSDYGNIERTIHIQGFTKLDFEYPKDAATRAFDKYTQHIRIQKDSAIIEIRGIDNGIYSDIIFEKIEGKWRLKTWNDEST